MPIGRQAPRKKAARERKPPWYGTVRPVVWEDGGGDPASYPLAPGMERVTVILFGYIPKLK